MKKGLIWICALMAVLMAVPALAQSTGVYVDGKTYVITGGDGTYEMDGKTFIIEGDEVTVLRPDEEELHLYLEAAEENTVVVENVVSGVVVNAEGTAEGGTMVYTFAEGDGDVQVQVSESGEIVYTAVEDALKSSAVEFSAYAKYGLSYDENHDLLYYMGKPVRVFEDTLTVDGDSSASLWYFNDKGEVDVRALYDEDGGIAGLEALSEAEFAARSSAVWTEQSVTRMEMTATGGQELSSEEWAEFFAPYAEFGLRLEAETGNLYYQGQLVRKFVDVRASNGEELGSGKFSGELTQIINDEGEVDVTAVRDYGQPDASGEGKLLGLNVEQVK